MVRIVNGEIIRDDNDPRLRRQPQQPLQPPRETARGAGYTSAGATAAQPSQAPRADPLQGLSNSLGIGDRTVQIPAVLSFPSVDLPLIYVIIAALICIFAGIRGALAVVVGYFVYAHSLTRQQQQPPQQPPQQQQRPHRF